jgi:nucleotide-binding universal stress UspA family protein
MRDRQVWRHRRLLERKLSVDTRPHSSRSHLGLGPSAGSILVAVNGRASGWQALDWAAAECAAYGSSLRIVHVVAAATPILDLPADLLVGWRDSHMQAGAWVLEQAARRARRVAPDVPIFVQMESGDVAPSIRDAGRCDALIVVGRGSPRRSGMRSTAWRVVRKSSTPVAVVELNQARASGPSAGRVIVGVNCEGGPPSVVAYAFQAASRRGTGLTAIHAWEPGLEPAWWSEADGPSIDLRPLVHVDGPLRKYILDYPDVDVRGRLVRGSAGEALVKESPAAALLVLGAGAQGRIHDALFSSVARIACRWAESPVAIIKSPAHVILLSPRIARS